MEILLGFLFMGYIFIPTSTVSWEIGVKLIRNRNILLLRTKIESPPTQFSTVNPRDVINNLRM